MRQLWNLHERQGTSKPAAGGWIGAVYALRAASRLDANREWSKLGDEIIGLLEQAYLSVVGPDAAKGIEVGRELLQIIIMFSVPLAAIGVVLALKLTGTTFSLQAYIGVIMLAGIVVSNAILLVDYTNILRRRDHMPLREAVETAGRTRLRPILMTTLATILGLVPMSLGIGEGAELQAPLARVVIGGLTASTLITLVVVPTVYTIFEEGWKGLRSGAPTHS
jgi:hypothetical protein